MQPQPEQRAVLFVVDRAKAAVDLVASLFAPADELGRGRRKLDRLESLTRLVREDGYEVGLVVAGSDTTRYLEQSPRPDALVMDVTAADEGCVAVACDARRMYPNLPIFVLTSLPELAAHACRDLEPPPVVFTKPLDYALFSAALGKAARQHSGDYVRVPSFLLDVMRGPSRGRS